MNPLESLESSGDAFMQAVTPLTNAQLASPSNCDDWSVRNLIEHVVRGCNIAVELVRGASAETARSLRSAPVTDDIVGALRAAIHAQLSALSDPLVATMTVHHPIIDMTGAQLIETRMVEFVVHHWDVRRSLALPPNTAIGLADAAWAVMEPLAELTPTLGVFGTGSMRAPDHTTSSLANLLDVTGRRVS